MQNENSSKYGENTCSKLIMYMRVFFAQLIHVYCKQIIWKYELEEYDENPIYAYFEKQYDRIFL